jgi:feruloyl esterase
LGAFRVRGGKLLQYHGWGDQVVPPRRSIAYHEGVQAKMGDTSDFGLLSPPHGARDAPCGGGPGPNEVATLKAIVAWVEQGRAPDRVLATKYTDDDPDKPIVRTGPLCPYPQRAAWDGKGNRDRAKSYRCRSKRRFSHGEAPVWSHGSEARIRV